MVYFWAMIFFQTIQRAFEEKPDVWKKFVDEITKSEEVMSAEKLRNVSLLYNDVFCVESFFVENKRRFA